MKKSFILFLLIAGVVGFVYAQVPRTISYQGFYTDASGNPVNGGPHKVMFRFFDATTNVETTSLAREIENVTINKGIISVSIGGGDPSHTSGPDNSALPLDVWTQAFKIQVFVNGDPIGAQVPLTTVPYAFVAGSVDGANVTGTLAASKISGTVAGAQIGTGINASNITTGTLNPALFTDGSIPGTKLALDINATNIASGTLSDSRLESTLDVTAVNTTGNITTGGGIHVGGPSDPGADNLVVDGTITGNGSGISTLNASNISSGTIADERLETNIDVAGFVTTVGGVHVGGTSDPGTDNLVVDGTVNAGAAKFVIDGNGNITKLNNLTYSFPASYSVSNTFLLNNGAGTLSWSSTLGVSNGGTGASTLTGALIGNGTSAVTARAATLGSQYLRRNAGNTDYEFGSLSIASSEIADGSVMNTDISASAAIAGSKINPDFSAQNVVTTGNVTAGDLYYGATKSKTLIINQSAFVLAGTNAAVFPSRPIDVGSGLTYLLRTQGGVAGNAAYFNAPLHLPDGAIITGMSATVFDNDGSNNATIRLGRSQWNSIGTVLSLASVSSAGASVSGSTITASAFTSTVDNASYSYFIVFQTTEANATIALYNVRITYTVTKPD